MSRITRISTKCCGLQIAQQSIGLTLIAFPERNSNLILSLIILGTLGDLTEAHLIEVRPAQFQRSMSLRRNAEIPHEDDPTSNTWRRVNQFVTPIPDSVIAIFSTMVSFQICNNTVEDVVHLPRRLLERHCNSFTISHCFIACLTKVYNRMHNTLM
jgi:hypothetical protein